MATLLPSILCVSKTSLLKIITSILASWWQGFIWITFNKAVLVCFQYPPFTVSSSPFKVRCLKEMQYLYRFSTQWTCFIHSNIHYIKYFHQLYFLGKFFRNLNWNETSSSLKQTTTTVKLLSLALWWSSIFNLQCSFQVLLVELTWTLFDSEPLRIFLCNFSYQECAVI